MTEEQLAYLALTQVPGMGPARLAALLTAYPSPLGAHSAPFEHLCTVPGFSRAMATALKDTPLAIGQKTLDAAQQQGFGLGHMVKRAGEPSSFSLLLRRRQQAMDIAEHSRRGRLAR